MDTLGFEKVLTREGQQPRQVTISWAVDGAVVELVLVDDVRIWLSDLSDAIHAERFNGGALMACGEG